MTLWVLVQWSWFQRPHVTAYRCLSGPLRALENVRSYMVELLHSFTAEFQSANHDSVSACAVTLVSTDSRHCLLVSSKASQLLGTCECLYDFVYRAVWICRVWLCFSVIEATLNPTASRRWLLMYSRASQVFGKCKCLRVIWMIFCSLYCLNYQYWSLKSANHCAIVQWS
jgi:hypothetical protein